ncbi:MAG: BLUF domain-containing protein [Pirellula sp.]|jgi:hypothetical protein
MSIDSNQQLCRLTYYSTAKPGLDFSDLHAILTTAEEKNTQNGVTGALVFADCRFAQILEGPRSALSSTFARILLDDRHSMVCLVEFAECAHRIFADWSMKHLHVQRKFMEKSDHMGSFVPDHFDSQELLSMFVNLHKQNLPQ